MYRTPLSRLGWCPKMLLGIVRQVKKRICRIVGPSLAASLEPLVHCQNMASLSLFYRYYFGRCFSELAQLVPLLFSWGRSTHYSDRSHDLSVTIPRYYKDFYVNSFFPWFSPLFLIKKCLYIGYRADTQQRLFYTLSTYFQYINMWFHKMFFWVYIEGVTSEQEEIGQKA